MPFDLRKLDIYRKTPKDLTQPTLTGAVISVVACFLIGTLLFLEVWRFCEGEIVSEVYVDDPRVDGSDRINVELKLELAEMPCEYLGLDIQDDLGRHEVGFVKNTVKRPMGDGCHFHAAFQINKVPGNFHISTHSSPRQPPNPNFSHKIIEVIFGERILKQLPGSFNPLSGVERNETTSHDYMLKVVPTVYEGEFVAIGYQYTFVHRTHSRSHTPAIWFRYELSPLTVKYRLKVPPFFTFLTSVCAIVGGIFTVASMLDSLLHTATQLLKKRELGKLS